MSADRDEVLEGVLELVEELADDWEYDGEVSEKTRFLEDMGLESLDLVVISTMIQQKYGKLPFTEWLASIGERPADERDVSVGELVDFIVDNRQEAAA